MQYSDLSKEILNTEADKALLEHLAKHLIDHGDSMSTRQLEALPCYSQTSFDKLRRLGLAKYDTDTSIKIHCQAIAVNKEPSIDYKQKLKSWAYNNKWRAVPFIIVVYSLPYVLNYLIK